MRARSSEYKPLLCLAGWGWIGWCFLFAVYVAAHTSHIYHHHHIMAISMNLEYNIKADTHIFYRFKKVYGAASDIRFPNSDNTAQERWHAGN
jgi:hypothetical protein